MSVGLGEIERRVANVARDGRREVIRDIRCAIELCTRCGLEMVNRFPGNLSLRVPDRNSLPFKLSLSRIRNSSLRSTLKATISERMKQDAGDIRTPLRYR